MHRREIKYNQILDALQTLLEDRTLSSIPVSEIAQTAGIGKGSIYYYFPSKEAMMEALVQRKYEAPIETAKALSRETTLSPFTKMAMIFKACRRASSAYLCVEGKVGAGAQEKAFLRQTYQTHLISELKPVLAEIIRQGIMLGEISFPKPEALAEIALMVLVRLNDSTPKEEAEETIFGLIALLERVTNGSPGSLDFLMDWEEDSTPLVSGDEPEGGRHIG